MVRIYFLHTGDNIPFYVGETSKSLKKRLNDHKRKYGSEINIDLNTIKAFNTRHVLKNTNYLRNTKKSNNKTRKHK